MLGTVKEHQGAKVAEVGCTAGTEIENDAGWLVGPDPQRGAVEAHTQVLGESSRQVPGKVELWGLVNLNFSGSSRISAWTSLLDHMSTFMASSFEGCSSFLSSWKEAANKQGGEVLCTRVATLRDHREIWGRKQLQVTASVIQLLKELRPYCDLV